MQAAAVVLGVLSLLAIFRESKTERASGSGPTSQVSVGAVFSSRTENPLGDVHPRGMTCHLAGAYARAELCRAAVNNNHK
jgi:hypothetical protein